MLIDNEEAKNQINQLRVHKTVQAIRVPTKQTNNYHKKIKAIHKMFDPVNIEKIRTDGESKIILVSDDFKIDDLNLNEHEKKQVQMTSVDVDLTYNNLSTQQIFNHFQDLLNKQSQNNKKQYVPYPNSFETAGHIAHYNLTPQQSAYKQIIGQITLAKCLNIKTVVNKTQKLHNVYRTPVLEHMAGQKNYQVKMKEVGVNFHFDFERVYWCSRLQKQRDRVLEYIKPEQCLADLFCGVGPLAVRAAKKGAYVIANDLNPSCYEFLVKNCKANSVQGRVMCWNMCAREAVKKIYAEHQTYDLPFRAPDHIYMNLPVDAIQFLDALKDYGQNMKTQKMPLVHVNCFVVANTDQESVAKLTERVNKVLPGFVKEDIVNLHHIKNVTVIMRMYCLTFKLKPEYNKVEQAQPDQVIDKVQKKIKEI